MTFILRMAVRETRAAWRRLLFFFLCIAIGVGAIAALRSAIQNVGLPSFPKPTPDGNAITTSKPSGASAYS